MAMTGRDLIIHILQNNLLDTPVYEKGRLIGFMSVMEAAVKFNTGEATIRAWIKEDLIDYIQIGSIVYIPENSISPKERLENEKDNSNTCCMPVCFTNDPSRRIAGPWYVC